MASSQAPFSAPPETDAQLPDAVLLSPPETDALEPDAVLSAPPETALLSPEASPPPGARGRQPPSAMRFSERSSGTSLAGRDEPAAKLESDAAGGLPQRGRGQATDELVAVGLHAAQGGTQPARGHLRRPVARPHRPNVIRRISDELDSDRQNPTGPQRAPRTSARQSQSGVIGAERTRASEGACPHPVTVGPATASVW